VIFVGVPYLPETMFSIIAECKSPRLVRWQKKQWQAAVYTLR